MPIYEYICLKCNEAFSAIKFSYKADDPLCPKCGSSDIKKKVSLFSSFSTCAGGAGNTGTGQPSGGGGGGG